MRDPISTHYYNLPAERSAAFPNRLRRKWQVSQNSRDLQLTVPCYQVKNRYVFNLLETSETIQCPYCGQSFDLIIDTSISSQRFTTDCEVCCRPFEVVADCEPGEILSLDVLEN